MKQEERKGNNADYVHLSGPMVIVHSPEGLARISCRERKGQKDFKDGGGGGGRRGKSRTDHSTGPFILRGKANPGGSEGVRNMKGRLGGLRGTLVYNLVKGGSHTPLEAHHLSSQGT